MTDAQTSTNRKADCFRGQSAYQESQTSPAILERVLKDINPATKRELSLHAVHGIRNELSSRAMRREYERAMRKMGKRGML